MQMTGHSRRQASPSSGEEFTTASAGAFTRELDIPRTAIIHLDKLRNLSQPAQTMPGWRKSAQSADAFPVVHGIWRWP
jgi:hypothetical protein